MPAASNPPRVQRFAKPLPLPFPEPSLSPFSEIHMSKLTYSARKSMPKSSFALPAKKSAGNPAGKGAYPIPDANHARDALSRVSVNGSPAEKSKVRAAVRRKYPGVHQSSMLGGK